METVKDTSTGVRLPQNLIDNARVWLFPSLNFNCTGNITKWIFQAENVSSNGDLPQMQVWRENTLTPTLDYVLQSNTGNEDELSEIEASVYEYVLGSPVPVDVGDIFGVGLPEEQGLLLQFQDFGPGGAPISYISPRFTTFVRVDQQAPNLQYLPLATAVFGKYSSFIIVHFYVLSINFLPVSMLLESQKEQPQSSYPLQHNSTVYPLVP